ncbi:MAG: ATP-dependent RNA helicase HrpA [Acidimicrobiales bacterium]
MSTSSRPGLDVTYPSELPITDRRDELAATIAAHPVVVVAGETGSGKSTQLPKICLELGRGADGAMIGHTQPRRLAARTIAARVADELGVELGGPVGYAVRFNDRVGPDTRLKLMTDGILLAELARDRTLSRYDTIIIDEAHERSLNIDFILGYLKQLLPRRPDLKVIITSATIDTERFSRHFDDAPVISVSGRLYPVEVRYRPLEDAAVDGGARDETEGISDAVSELWQGTTGDILVFCSGEREIRDAADAVADLDLPGSEILPLYSRLSAAEQQRVFAPHRARRVVIATNVAETSVTVPGVRSVIDVGTARISRYSARTKVQRLPIEPVSQASADQRAGRCGRLGPGVCIRLYSEDDYLTRPEFTEPEIQRTNLAAVILQMTSLGLGDVARFPFVDRPDDAAIRDGIALLEELAAFTDRGNHGPPGRAGEDAGDPDRGHDRGGRPGRRGGRNRRGRNRGRRLSRIGRSLARLPVDPRYGRMLVEAAREGCGAELMIIISGLSIQDPRERPAEKRQAAEEFHRRFRDNRSDFVAYLNLWDYLEHQRKTLSRNQFRRMCRREFLNYHRVVEWRDLHNQLRREARRLELGSGVRRHPRPTGTGEPVELSGAQADAIHRSILSGLLSHVGRRDPRTERARPTAPVRGRRPRRPITEYLGARGTRFAIAPGSGLTAHPPGWVMAAELVETSRLWARDVATVDPDWIEPLARHLITVSHGEPWWDAERGAALVPERVTLYGLTLVADRPRALTAVDRDLARDLFIHHALIDGEWHGEHDFVARNQARLAEVEQIEARSRRRDLLVEHQTLHDWYDARLPDDVATVTEFDTWWTHARSLDPARLDLTVEDLLRPTEEVGALVDPTAFPHSWVQGGLDLELVYTFDPTSHLDGVSVLVPVEHLAGLDAEPFAWTVPGFRRELITALARSLPKATRKALTPVADTAADAAGDIGPGDGPLLDVLADTLGKRRGLVIRADQFDPSRVPPHVRPTFRVINDDYELLAEGKDLEALRAELVEETRRSIADRAAADGTAWERSGLTDWTVGDLPRSVDLDGVTAYPALVDDGDSVSLRLVATEDEQHNALWLGVRRLLRLALPSPVRRLDRLIPPATALALVNGPVQAKAAWYVDAIDACLDAILIEHGGPPWTTAGWEQLVTLARARFDDLLADVAAVIVDVVALLEWIQRRLDQVASAENYGPSLADARAHLHRLTYPGFLTGVGHERWPDLVRYLDGLAVRLENLTKSPTRDLELTAVCRRLDNELAEQAARAGSPARADAVEELVWMLEELRVGLFAQTLGTSSKVSEKRARRALTALKAVP